MCLFFFNRDITMLDHLTAPHMISYFCISWHDLCCSLTTILTRLCTCLYLYPILHFLLEGRGLQGHLAHPVLPDLGFSCVSIPYRKHFIHGNIKNLPMEQVHCSCCLTVEA